MLIVADTGPIITLIQIAHLKTFEALFPDFVLPDIVFEELKSYEPIQQREEYFFHLKDHVRKPKQLLSPVEGLDMGEIACVSLYYELKANAILIEDRVARQWVENRGIHCLGSIAVLIKAKRQGLIDRIKPLLMEIKK